MKKIMTIMIAVTMIFASCSKERKLNKRLDGDWNVVTVNGYPLDAGESLTFSFNKDKKDDGTFTLTWVDAGDSEAWGGTYILNKDEEIVMTYAFFGFPETLTVQSYSKEDMTIKSSDGGEVYILKKK